MANALLNDSLLNHRTQINTFSPRNHGIKAQSIAANTFIQAGLLVSIKCTWIKAFLENSWGKIIKSKKLLYCCSISSLNTFYSITELIKGKTRYINFLWFGFNRFVTRFNPEIYRLNGLKMKIFINTDPLTNEICLLMPITECVVVLIDTAE